MKSTKTRYPRPTPKTERIFAWFPIKFVRLEYDKDYNKLLEVKYRVWLEPVTRIWVYKYSCLEYELEGEYEYSIIEEDFKFWPFINMNVKHAFISLKKDYRWLIEKIRK